MNKIAYLILAFFISTSVFGQWEIQTISPDGCLEEIEFTSNSKGYIVGSSIIGKTDNGGEIWIWDTSIGGAFRIIDFINPDTALICCFPYLGEDVIITFDGALTWVLPDLYVSIETNDMDLTPNGNIISAVGYAFYGSNVFVTEGFYSNITNNSVIASDIPPYDIDFINNEIGFICGRLSSAAGTTVFKTLDGGVNWYTNENMNGPVYEMTFPSLNIGYGIGDDSRVWKTIDGGESWDMLPFDFGGYDVIDGNLILNNVYFFNDTIGYLEVGFIYPDFTEGIFIYKTNNGGNSWYKTKIIHEEFDGINSMWCTSADTCYAIGCVEVYKTTNGGGIDTATAIINEGSPLQFYVSPNPASDYLRIKSDNFKPNLRFTVFNSLSNEILEGFLSSADYLLNVKDLPSGLYYLTITDETQNVLFKLFIK